MVPRQYVSIRFCPKATKTYVTTKVTKFTKQTEHKRFVTFVVDDVFVTLKSYARWLCSELDNPKVSGTMLAKWIHADGHSVYKGRHKL
jgi:hypothetical protein